MNVRNIFAHDVINMGLILYIYNAIQHQKANNPLLKMGRRTEKIFFQRRNADGQLAHEKMLNTTNNQGNSNKNHNEISLHT